LKMDLNKRSEEIVRLYRPGAYFFKGSSEETVRAYFKMEKEAWLSLVKCDYTLALVRRDAEAASKLRKAFDTLKTMLDWQDDALKEVEEKFSRNPSEAAMDAVQALFKLYAKEVQEKSYIEIWEPKLALGGWRAKPGETVKEGDDRGLAFEASVKGDLFRMEWSLWFAISHKLNIVADERRKARDRVGYWFAAQLHSKIEAYIFGEGRSGEGAVDPYLENAIEDSVAGRDVDYWEATSQYYLNMASYLYTICKGRRPGNLLDYDLGAARGAAESIVKALMAKLRVEPDSISPEDFLKQVTEKMGTPQLLELYRECVNEPKVDWKSYCKTIMERHSKQTEAAEREAVSKCRYFVGVMKHIFFTKPEDREFTLVIGDKEF